LRQRGQARYITALLWNGDLVEIIGDTMARVNAKFARENLSNRFAPA